MGWSPGDGLQLYFCCCFLLPKVFGFQKGESRMGLCFLFFPQGRFTIAAKHHITIAEIYETELVDIEKVS